MQIFVAVYGILKSFCTYKTKTKSIFADVKGFQFHGIPIRNFKKIQIFSSIYGILKSFCRCKTKTKSMFADVKGFQFYRIPIRI